MISYIWKRDGKWAYADNEKNEELNIVLPLPDGLDAPIEHFSAGDAREILGVFTCPSGEATGQITSTQNKSQEWIDRSKEGNPPRRDVWFLMDHQLSPTVGYVCAACLLPGNS